MPGKRKPVIILVSDGSAETATRVLQAAAVQFEGVDYRCIRRPNVRTAEQVHQVIGEAENLGAIIFFTLVGVETRKAMQEAMGRHIEIIDLLGPVITALHSRFRIAPEAIPGLLQDQEQAPYDGRTAFDYVFNHDDGQRINDLEDADLVLVGVSRSSKSSTCFYLAFQGIRAANVPLIPGIPPPPQLLNLPKNRVIGLRINVMRLLRVRQARMPFLNLDADQAYVDRRAVAEEVNAANRLMDKQKWKTVDVSYLAVEEIARQVLHLRWSKRHH
jgi:regulator of PEP synthase PpsR (kinase-PPPase family)